MCAIKRYHVKKRLVCDLTIAEWDEAVAYFGGCCAYCGEETELQKEHIIPVSRGGGFTKRNIVPACIACNQSKGGMSLHEWYKYSEVYSHQRLLKLIGWIYGEKARTEIEVQSNLTRQTG